MQTRKLMAIDGNAILTRAFYGIRDMTTADGRHTNAIYGFLKMLGRFQREESPEALCVAFDLSRSTFRKEMYAGYKANRTPQPEELRQQEQPMRDILQAMNIPVYALEHWEADDILGTIARIDSERGWETVIVTGDRDLLQLVSHNTTVKLIRYQDRMTVTNNYTPELFYSEYGFPPSGIVELKALMGDASDNIPGVKGIGEKRAMSLIRRYGTVDWIYDHALAEGELLTPEGKSQPPSIRKMLEDGRENALMSQDLATIRRNAPIRFAPENDALKTPDTETLRTLLNDLELNSIAHDYGLA